MVVDARLSLADWCQVVAGWLITDMDPEMPRDETTAPPMDRKTCLRREIAKVVATWGPHSCIGVGGTSRQDTIDRVR